MSIRKASRNITPLSILAAVAAFAVLAVMVTVPWPVGAHDANTPEFTGDKKLKIPEAKIWREWTFIGTPVTPNALNSGSADRSLGSSTVSRLMIHGLSVAWPLPCWWQWVLAGLHPAGTALSAEPAALLKED